MARIEEFIFLLRRTTITHGFLSFTHPMDWANDGKGGTYFADYLRDLA